MCTLWCLMDRSPSYKTPFAPLYFFGHWNNFKLSLCCPAFFALCSIYTQLKHCVDNSAAVSQCRGRGSLMDEVFLKVHEMYFSDCGLVQDPPLFTLVMLIAPVTIVTLLLPLLYFYLTPRDASVIWFVNSTATLEALLVFEIEAFVIQDDCL